jgi:membrane-associated phospholipid phosphatase
MSASTSPPDARGSVFGRDPGAWRSRGGRFLAETHRRIASRVGVRGASLAGLAVGGMIVAASTAAAILVYDNVTGKDGVACIDRPTLAFGKRHRSPAADLAAGAIAEAFGPIGMPILTAAAGTAVALHRKSRDPFELVAAAGAGSLLMTLLGKQLVHRNRPARRDAAPPYERSPSFPSGHTVDATTILGTLAYLLIEHARSRTTEPVLAGAAVGAIATVGASRILLGAHWFTDVLMGWTTGAGWLTAIITVHRLHTSTRNH